MRDASLYEFSQAGLLICSIFLTVFVQKPTRQSMNLVGFRHQVQDCRDMYCVVYDSKSCWQALTPILKEKFKKKKILFFKNRMMDEPETQ